jgi:hypothetical protein
MAQKFNYPFGTGGKTITKPAPTGMDAGMPGEEDGAAIANEHGPATEVHMTHDHDMGVHHVSSVHPDGHTHESDHGSAEEAHEHGKKLAGVGAEMKDPAENGGEAHDEEEW